MADFKLQGISDEQAEKLDINLALAGYNTEMTLVNLKYPSNIALSAFRAINTLNNATKYINTRTATTVKKSGSGRGRGRPPPKKVNNF